MVVAGFNGSLPKRINDCIHVFLQPPWIHANAWAVEDDVIAEWCPLSQLVAGFIRRPANGDRVDHLIRHRRKHRLPVTFLERVSHRFADSPPSVRVEDRVVETRGVVESDLPAGFVARLSPVVGNRRDDIRKGFAF